MHRLGVGLILVLTACSSSQDEASTGNGEQSPESGITHAVENGGGGAGGGAPVLAGNGGSSSDSGAGGGHAPGVGGGGSAGGAGAGGKTGVGGSAGAGGGIGDAGVDAPHLIGQCGTLGAVGEWQEITPPTMSPLNGSPFYQPSAFQLDPLHPGTVYLGTDSFNDGHSKGLFKTTDCGASWTHVSTGTNSAAIDGGREWTMQIDFVDSQVIYTNSGYYKLGLFKSINGGVDWADITAQGDGAPGFLGDLQLDPEDSRHLLSTWHSNCGNYADGIGCFAETKDGGATWKEHYGTPPWPGQVRVLLLHGSTWVVLADSMLLTTDGGATFKSVLGTAAGGHSSGTLYRAKNGDFYVGSEYGMIRGPAASDGAEWSVVANSGAWIGDMAESPTTMFATQQQNRLETSPVGDGVKWTVMQSGPTGCERAHYDLDHHLLYAECAGNGFWRVVTQ